MKALKIGDTSPTGSVVVVDEDRLCYLVRNSSKGAKGIRTISKALLNEFVAYVEKYPDASANEARETLSGTSELDKFEYGYASTLVTMAKMVLDGNAIEGEKDFAISQKQVGLGLCLQQIYYGAPGTGKSHIIKQKTKGESVIRTTFHPDSDYSTFVGCYKPTTKPEPRYTTYGNQAVIVKDKDGNELTEDRIVYEFVDQAFLQAYVKAWKFYAEAGIEGNVQKQFLVIEEINRGNCAQIFGDLFQLLDRNEYGFSDYSIQADNDMKKQLAKAFKDLTIPQADRINECCGDDVVQRVLKGEILLLPDNLYIWATMNTSDQSLFPIDSAFKRRWDWQYMPISKGTDVSDAELNWVIEAGDKKYDWWSFLTKINEQIGATTNSEDKKLGFFFCKAINGAISAETFVGKVIFYLWNDVFKDYGFDAAIFNDDIGTLTFDKFYMTEKQNIEVGTTKIQKFLDNLKVEVIGEAAENTASVNDETTL